MSDEKRFTPPIPEKPILSPEAVPERRENSAPDTKPRPVEQKDEQLLMPPIPVASAPQQPHVDKTQMRHDIEKVLEQDLDYIYVKLPEKQRIQFKIEGEKTAAAIENVMHSAKRTIWDIIRLIRDWLLLIPGVNQFFAEREAKIKAERIFSLSLED